MKKHYTALIVISVLFLFWSIALGNWGNACGNLAFIILFGYVNHLEQENAALRQREKDRFHRLIDRATQK